MTTTLTPKKLVSYLRKHYDENYQISEEIAIKVLKDCEEEYDNEFTEEELLETIEKYLD